jgi:acetylglutamate kinase
METFSTKAQTLVDSLPHLRQLQNALVVVKYGGSVIEEAIYGDSILTDISYLRHWGIPVVLVHGGGKAISNKMREEGITPKFVNGLRYTDKKTVKIVDQVLSKTINPQIVNGLKQRGTLSISLSGKKVLKGKKLVTTASDGQKVSLGFVGDITTVNKAPIMALLKKGITPVITPLAAASDGSTLNINADIAASKIAGELKATHLIFLSDTNGILEDSQNSDSTIVKISESEIEALRSTGVINGGMLPKVNASIDALKKGVKRIKLLNGQLAHCILIDLLLNPKVGTEIVSQ